VSVDAPVEIRPATPEQLPAVSNVLDGGLLEVDGDALSEAIETEDVLVALSNRGDEETVLGVIVLDGDEILAIAVRRRRRSQGIGTTLVGAASERRERLVAEFDERVRPFWESLGFAIEVTDETGRYRGRRPV